MHVKHCYTDLASWYEFWFAIICIDMGIILDLSTTVPQFQRRFQLPVKLNGPGKWANMNNLFYWTTMTGNYSSTDGSLLKKNVKIKCKECFPRLLVKQRGYFEEFPDCAITYHICQHHSWQPERQNIIDRMHTTMFGYYIDKFHRYRRVARVCFELHSRMTPGQFRSAAVG